MKLADQQSSQFFVFRHSNLRSLLNHETLIVDTQFASRSLVCILLDLPIQTLTSCNQAFEKGNTQIKRQNFRTASPKARDGDAPKRLSVSCSNSPCSTDNWKLCSTTKAPDTPRYIPSAQCIGYVFCSFAVLPLESLKALQKLRSACLPSGQVWLRVKIGVRHVIGIHGECSTFQLAPPHTQSMNDS
jgi:hypothetical protein